MTRLLRALRDVALGLYSAAVLVWRRPYAGPGPMPPCVACLACGEDIPEESQDRAVCQRCRDFMREEWREADTEPRIRVVGE